MNTNVLMLEDECTIARKPTGGTTTINLAIDLQVTHLLQDIQHTLDEDERSANPSNVNHAAFAVRVCSPYLSPDKSVQDFIKKYLCDSRFAARSLETI
jgi:hypothetical protein